MNMTSSLEDIEGFGGFITAQPVKKTVTWPRAHLGKEDVDVDVWVRQMTAADFEVLMGLPKDHPKLAATVATLIRFGENAEQAMDAEKAASLDPYLMLAFTDAINSAAPKGNG